MKTISVLHLLFLFVFISCNKDDNDPQTQTVNLQLDGYTSGGTKAFNAGFMAGETVGVTLGPVANTFQVTFVEFFFGGTGSTPTTRNVVLAIYEDTGAGTPGPLLFSATYSVSADDNLIQQVDLTDDDIIMNGGGSIRIAIEMTEDGLPSVARDADGTISNSGNWIKTGGSWVSANSLGLTGDFIIRATVEENI